MNSAILQILILVSYIDNAHQDIRHTREKRDLTVSQPRIVTQNGHLIFETAADHNISLISRGNGFVNLAGHDITNVVRMIHDNKDTISQLQTGDHFSTFTSRLEDVESQASINAGTANTVQSSLADLTQQIQELTTRVEGLEASDAATPTRSPNVPVTYSAYQSLRRKVDRLQNTVNRIKNKLETDTCSSSPCSNGGVCVNLYDDYHCRCTPQWTGRQCQTDVNECATLSGSGMGCQNGGTCLNIPGGYQCTCPANYHGVRCTEQHDDCSPASSHALCGHGTCLNKARVLPGQPHYDCLCEDGWTKSADSSSPTCTIDEDECVMGTHMCSRHPIVRCINTPGSYQCGLCPAGYTGDGRTCSDINECILNNGGCSVRPHVTCVNTPGSFTCEPCPEGYSGNGQACVFVGLCAVNNGGCHPTATCQEHAVISGRICTCPSGSQGSGVGPSGCMPSAGTSVVCSPNPCQNDGHCTLSSSGSNYQCICMPGYSGDLCEVMTLADQCSSSPCLNGGTCTRTTTGYTCECRDGWSGDTCSQEDTSCGGVLRRESGTISVPGNVQHSDDTVSCGWIVTTLPNKVLTLTFSRMQIVCGDQFLQLHDGDNAGARMIDRYCGSTIPSNINTTTNSLYVWFHAVELPEDENHGLSFSWATVDPVCGGYIEEDHGAINSPGYPGNYPPSRYCQWIVKVSEGKKISFSFAHLAMEHHSNCSYDFLQINDGMRSTDPVLERYCGTSNPEPLVTTGPYASIVFHSDGSEQDSGFHITYHSIPAFPGCGGVMTSPSGYLRSPGYPDPYPHDAHCVWRITVHEGEQIRFTFQHLDLEVEPNCLFDYVEIRDGGDESARFVGRYCGSDIPSVYFSTRNELWVNFKSDSSNTHAGFRASYDTACGGSLTTPQGVLQSPYYPDPYPGNRDCVYFILAPEGYLISLTFVMVDIESGMNGCNTDYLEVRDGGDSTAPLLSRVCGSSSAAPLMTSSNEMWLKFVSDSPGYNLTEVQHHGFQATYTTMAAANVPGLCGGTYNAAAGAFTSPEYPNVFPSGVNCTYFITVDPDLLIRLTFVHINLNSWSDCSSDRIQVYDSSEMDSEEMIGSYCGTSPPAALTSSGNSMVVYFESGDYSSHGQGFSAAYHTLNATTVCGYNLHSSSGVISSPPGLGVSRMRADCIWKISVDGGQRIRLNATEFDLPNGYSYNNYHYYNDYSMPSDERSCLSTTHYLEIRNGLSETSPLIGRYCGSSILEGIVSHSNHLWIHFHSDYSASRRGFRIVYDSMLTGCGGSIAAAAQGWLTSPGYPTAYPSNSRCYWTIHVPQGNAIQFLFVDFDVETGGGCSDTLMLQENDRNGNMLRQLCRNQAYSPVRTTISTVYMTFRSDHSISGRGFNIFYQTECNRTLTAMRGVIESPTYQGRTAFNCQWIIQSTPGNQINVSFSHLDLQSSYRCNNEYVELLDSVTGPSLGRFCQNDMIQSFHSEEQFVVRYKTTRRREGYWRLEYVINGGDGCGGDFTRPSGNFTSPDYPNYYPHNRVCEWRITVAPGRSIQLTFREFDLEISGNCTYDAVEVHGGIDSSGPMLAQICHRQTEPLTISSTGNTMFIRFRTDLSSSGRGFQAYYETSEQACGGLYTAGSGMITSPGFPSSYPRSMYCVWRIEVQPHHTVAVTIHTLDLEGSFGHHCNYDHIYFYDGSSQDAPEITNMCGRDIPSQNSTVQSTSNVMFMLMRSDGSVQRQGFNATYNTACGGTYNVSGPGYLSSPRWPAPYPAGLNCTWYLVAPPGEFIAATVTSLDFGLNSDCNTSLTTWIGFDMDSDGIQLCRHEDSPNLMVFRDGSSSVMRTEFISSPAQAAYPGFRIEYDTEFTGCGRDFTGPFGVVHYTNDDQSAETTECTWTVSPITNFVSSDHCNGDYFEVREDNIGGPVLRRICSFTPQETSIESEKKLFIKMRAFRNDGGSPEELRLMYHRFFGGDYTGQTGSIVSSSYPSLYHNNLDLEWTITTDLGMRLRLIFEYFEVESGPRCMSDYLLIHDGADSDSPLLVRYCGQLDPSESIVLSSSNQVHLHFVTDSTINDIGFKINWVSFTGGSEDSTSSTDPECGGEFTATDDIQTLTSPGYPYGYARDLDCMWRLTAPTGRLIWINVTDIHLEHHTQCFYDALTVLNNDPTSTIATLCGSTGNEEPLITASSRAAISFTSDHSVNRTGFSLDYKITGCGGRIRIGSTSGSITSPGFEDGAYPNDLNCTWTFLAPADHTVRISFTSFYVQYSSGCTNDYVQVFNGEDTSSPSIGQLCSSGGRRLFSSNSTYLTVSFITDSTDSNQGFNFTYSSVGASCSDHLTLTPQSTFGTLESPNYPDDYPRNVDCMWVIMAPPGNRIHVDFINQFRIEQHSNCIFDYVEFRDGGTIHSRLLGTVCGMQTPSSVTTTGNVMYIRFRTDGSQTYTGFQIRYQIATCGGRLSAAEGTFTSPGHPNRYDVDLDCEWNIVGSVGHYLTLNVQDFDLEATMNCSGDSLAIHNWNASGEALLSDYCGHRTDTSVTTYGNQAYVHFISDSTNNYDTGFTISFNSSIEECGGTLTDLTGTITSPGYPQVYTHGRSCGWVIRSPPGQRITLSFDDFALEGHRRCLYDSLTIFNGEHFPTFVGRWCGTNYPSSVESSGDTMTIFFQSDSSVHGRGFSLSYHTRMPAVCGGTLNAISGIIQSPGYTPVSSTTQHPFITTAPTGEHPTYNNSVHCAWHISLHAHRNATIVLSFNDFALESHSECRYDYVRFVEGDPDGDILGRFCGNSTDTGPVTSTGGSLWVYFIADASIVDRGFQLQYSVQECGGVLKDASGQFTSPQFPNSYPAGSNCDWRIQGHLAQQVQLHFNSFSLPNNDPCVDFVEIFNGPSSTSPSIGKFCGGDLPADFLSYSSDIRVTFQSSGSSSGFSATYTIHSSSCGGVVHSQSGQITSPLWPNAYPASIECIWEVYTRTGYHVQWDWLAPYHMEFQDPCQNDYVELSYNDDSERRNEIGRFCGHLTPPTQRTSSNHLRVKFRSNDQNSDSGFGANFTAVCGQNYTVSEGYIVSPGYPTQYSNNLRCLYVINAPTPSDYVELTFQPEIFGIEGGRSCPYDYVKVYRGNTTDNTALLRTVCGSYVPGLLYAQSSLTLEFITDGSVIDRGWRAYFNTSSCGGTLGGASGTFTTPTRGGRYYHSANCTWLIQGDPQKIIELKFNSFVLETHSQCRYDAVSVYDGTNINSTLIGRYCGNLIPEKIMSTGENLLVVFTTDSSSAFDGFQATYRSTYGPVQGCGGHFNSSSGSFSSIDVDNNGYYEADLDCLWTINVPVNNVIQLTINNFAVEQTTGCVNDYLKIYDGNFESDAVIGQYCGSGAIGTITSASNNLRVRFYTDEGRSASGFTATYTSTPSLCGGVISVLHNTSAVITSDNYPSFYSANQNCRWIISGPDDEQLALEVLDMNIQPSTNCIHDYIELREHGQHTSPMAQSRHYCGNVAPPVFYSHGPEAQVNFVTDQLIAMSGFKINASIAGCNRTYDSTSGRIVSPGWPGNYRHSSNCWMLINSTAPLAVYFNEFQVESHSQCNFDFLRIYNGSSSNATVRNTLCGYQLPTPIFTTSSQLLLHFKSDSSVQRNGFDITYVASQSGIPGCSGTLESNNGTLSSPGFPGHVPNNTACEWLITVPPRKVVNVQFTIFDLRSGNSSRCSGGALELINGDSAQAPLVGRYCDMELPADFTSQSRTVMLKLNTYQNTAGIGFSLRFTSADRLS